ncbi:MAG: LysR substrate-binding domain-containing protein [Rhizobiaceae bacterium]
MAKPTLRQLEYALAIADTGQFGRAAQRLNVSQPSLSAQIAELEANLDVRIFNRGRNGASPTASGHEIIRRARLVLREVEDIVALSRDDGLFGGRLRLGVLPSIGPYLLPEVVRKLHSENPELRLMLKEESTLRLEDDLRNGRLDMIISTPEDHLGTHQVPLFSERFWAAFARDDPLSRRSGPVSKKELRGRSLLTLDRTHRLSRMVQMLAQDCGASVLEDYQGTSLDAIRLMAATGSGIAILPHIYTATEARRGRDIELRPFSEGLAQRRIALIQSADGEPRYGTTLLVSALKNEAELLMRA